MIELSGLPTVLNVFSGNKDGVYYRSFHPCPVSVVHHLSLAKSSFRHLFTFA